MVAVGAELWKVGALATFLTKPQVEDHWPPKPAEPQLVEAHMPGGHLMQQCHQAQKGKKVCVS